MKLLCADTATQIEALAITLDGQPLIEHNLRADKGHGPSILGDIDWMLRAVKLSLDDLDGFVCGRGPGSFTGLRISLATLKGLAMATGKPIYGARTGATLWRAGALSVLDARRGEVYADHPAWAAPCCCRPSALIERLIAEGRAGATLLGDGALAYADQLRAAGFEIPTALSDHIPRAARLVDHLGDARLLATLEPLYIRRADAEINYPEGFPDATEQAPRGQRGHRSNGQPTS
ncbi:tRNA (adenosine(37)-N6)-threonylcarbamoyltransferase complex dimerization subunit type 1 TsaB [Myxococcota bacterium]|nr:tRNA (adenosine(37)-N6)-threonylcarbamoyltransferase complex dimerization subunit type 1 TsaB [Myxococcota bacterium]MBU1431210.1 tRNA (adenosine(37)-N6)-threonylcarbamoyltransferase complex dimerization subunit type 1 TsaB [Myxococcota bacterium]MBU1896799.1 tRNA (adenosine(37)-N6)-threonylcarbamoyltransferase complex dimerization subunit type 1 TsaB [Myxococcota bacterium]